MKGIPMFSLMTHNNRIDRVKFGITGVLPSTTLDELIENLTQCPEIRCSTPKSQQGNHHYKQVTIDLESEAGDVVGDAIIDFHSVKCPDGLRLGGRTALQINPQKLQRGLLGAEACGPLGFDGSQNVLALDCEQTTTAVLCQIVQDAVQFTIDAITHAMPNAAPIWHSLWLKSAEMCRDLSVNDSIRAMTLIQHSTLSGATHVVRDAYRAGAVDECGIKVARWALKRGAAWHKAYAKRRDTLRIEVACPDRAAVVQLTGVVSDEVSAAGAGRLLEGFGTAAEPALARIEEHVRLAMGDGPTAAQLLVKLAPLVALAAGMPARKGPPPSPGSFEAARDALEGLFNAGSFDARGVPAQHSVRRVLDALTYDGGPLKRDGRPAVFCLDPSYTGAAGVIENQLVTHSLC
jgi:hypothetical protein